MAALTSLELSRRIARSYRAELHAANPERCAQLDDAARELGQHWIAPTPIPAHLAEHALEAVLSAADIAHFWGIPVGTIYGWASKGLLEAANTDQNGKPQTGRAAKYRVHDVLKVDGRGRASRVDSA